MRKIKSWGNRHWVLLTSFLLLLYLLIFSLQGFDMTDEGFMLANYQQFFHHPESVGYSFVYYLTCFFGGIWNEIFGFAGNYGFRVFNALIIVMSYIIICKILKDYHSYRWWIFLGFVVVVFGMNVDHGTLSFHYYTFNAFNSVVITYLLYSGLLNNKMTSIFCACALIGANMFSRIPSLSLIVIPFALSFIVYLYRKSLFNWKRVCFIELCGISVGFLLIIGLIYLLGHQSIFLHSIKVNILLASHSVSTNSLGSMFIQYVINYLYVLLFMLILVAFIWCYGKYFRKNSLLKILFVGVFLFVLYRLNYSHMLGRMYLLVALLYVCLLYVMWKKRRNERIIVLCSILLAVSLLLPLGSDWGIGNMGAYSIWGLVPTTLVLTAKDIDSSKDRSNYKNILAIVFVFLALVYFKHNVRICFRDDGPRWEKNYHMMSSSYASVLTSVQRGEELDSLLSFCSKTIKADERVFIFPSMPGIHYLSSSIPYAYCSWPMCYSTASFEIELDRAKQELGLAPFVISLNHFDIQNDQHKGNYHVFDEYMRNYHKIWSSVHYSVWRPQNVNK